MSEQYSHDVFISSFLDCYIELAQLYDKEYNTDRSYLLWQKAYDLAKAVMVDGHPIIEKIKVKLEL